MTSLVEEEEDPDREGEVKFTVEVDTTPATRGVVAGWGIRKGLTTRRRVTTTRGGERPITLGTILNEVEVARPRRLRLQLIRRRQDPIRSHTGLRGETTIWRVSRNGREGDTNKPWAR